jgi:ribonucleoside-diphosphate reductase alpha chain
MRVFDAATNEVKQGGKRRGANMGILRVDHPDIEEFINCKVDGGITNFNISVGITDKFMEALESGGEYDLIDPRDNKRMGSLSAVGIFDKIAESAWRTGDPGLVFLDQINESSANPVVGLGPIESTNPCGEQPLYPFDSCNLGSIFLPYLAKEVDGEVEFDWEGLKRVVRVAVRFMDGVIEMNPYPLEEIRRVSLGIRRIGLGVGGWADLLIALGVPYDSEKALELGKRVMKTINEEAVRESQELSKTRGPFPLFEKSIYKGGKPRRHSTVTTIAPTGSISIIADTSGGIEPVFALAYQHIVKDKHLDRTLTFVNPKLEEVGRARGFWREETRQKVLEKGCIRDISEIPQDVRDVFGTAHEIHHDWHIRMQAVFQEYTENAVSKTINLRNEVDVNEVKKVYKLSYKSGCRGITVFRDGCKDAQVLNMGVGNGEKKGQEEVTLERPYKVVGSTYKLDTPVGTAFITINEDEKGEPIEVFINVGKAGSDVTAVAEALGRTISTSLRFRGDLSPRERAHEIANQLSGIGGRRSVGFGPNKIRSLPDAVSAALGNHLGFKVNGNGLAHESVESVENVEVGEHANGVVDHVSEGESGAGKGEEEVRSQVVFAHETEGIKGDICPSCGSTTFVYEEGCSKCYACGYSEC